MRLSTAILNKRNCLAIMVFKTIMAEPQLAEEPTARNSNLFPVKANGEVRLRSVLSSKICGILPILSFNSVLSCGVILPALMFFSRSSSNCVPINAEMIAGGASLAPKRWSLPAEAIAARNKSAFSWMAIMVFTKKVKNWRFDFGFLPGAKRFTPVLVLKDQLLCFPEPLTPANGFSCNNTRKLCLRAIFSMRSINKRLWSLAKLHSSKIGAHSNWFGATSLWRVVTGIPSNNDSTSNSRMNALTRSGIEPK